MTEYDSVPRFYPSSPNSRFELTWQNLCRAAGSKLSQDGYKQILGCKLYGDSALYFNLYKDRPLDQLVTILANRFCSDKSSEQYLQEIENYKRPKCQSLNQTIEELKFLILGAYKNKPREEQSAIMESTVRRAMPRLVSKDVLRNIYQEEKKHDNTGIPFNFIDTALIMDDTERTLPTPKTTNTLTYGLHQVSKASKVHKEKVTQNHVPYQPLVLTTNTAPKAPGSQTIYTSKDSKRPNQAIDAELEQMFYQPYNDQPEDYQPSRDHYDEPIKLNSNEDDIRNNGPQPTTSQDTNHYEERRYEERPETTRRDGYYQNYDDEQINYNVDPGIEDGQNYKQPNYHTIIYQQFGEPRQDVNEQYNEEYENNPPNVVQTEDPHNYPEECNMILRNYGESENLEDNYDYQYDYEEQPNNYLDHAEQYQEQDIQTQQPTWNQFYNQPKRQDYKHDNKYFA